MKNSRFWLTFLLILLLKQASSQNYNPAGSPALGLYDLKKIWNPHWFQGNLKNSNYFEGWYFKLVSADGNHRYAFIPGISLGNDPHSFVQLIDGKTGKTWYFRYDIGDFEYSRKSFAVRVGPNRFSEKGFSVSINENDFQVKGSIEFGSFIKYPVSIMQPGIMGWYRFVPFMECYHGVVSLDHSLRGEIIIGDTRYNFDEGRGYIEKDWGKSMPEAWVWMQSNTFEHKKNASFMLSVARIPWLGSSFTGFLGYLLYDGELFRFATYTRASIQQFESNEDFVNITIQDKKHTLHIKGAKGERGILLASVGGDMVRNIHESLDATITLRLENKKGEILFEGRARNAGLELVGDPNLLR